MKYIRPYFSLILFIILIFNGDIDARIKNSLNQIGILAYKHNSGGHYIAIKWNGEFFEIYNEGNTNSEASINEWLEKKGYKRLSLVTI